MVHHESPPDEIHTTGVHVEWLSPVYGPNAFRRRRYEIPAKTKRVEYITSRFIHAKEPRDVGIAASLIVSMADELDPLAGNAVIIDVYAAEPRGRNPMSRLLSAMLSEGHHCYVKGQLERGNPMDAQGQPVYEPLWKGYSSEALRASRRP